jgi:ribosomal protein S18 acetylase RimI-like enzyme
MAVRMKYRGKGYGLAVLDKLIEIAHQEGCIKIILETTHAQGLYFKRGFRIVRSREERGIRLDVMALDLD